MSAAAPVLGLLAGVMAVADLVPYLRDMRRGTTRPHRGAWLIWSVLAVVVFGAQCADGASWSLVILGAEAVGTSVVFALSIRLGSGGLSRTERALIVLAGGGVVAWAAADAPIIATTCVVAAELIATAMMVPKTWRDPSSETLSTYVLAGVGGALAAGSVGALVPSLLLYPVHFCLLNGALAFLILRRRKVLERGRPHRGGVKYETEFS